MLYIEKNNSCFCLWCKLQDIGEGLAVGHLVMANDKLYNSGPGGMSSSIDAVRRVRV
jgi:hypothetical protein